MNGSNEAAPAACDRTSEVFAARVRELVREHRSDGTAKDHVAALAALRAAKASVAEVEGIEGAEAFAARLEAFARLFAAIEVLPASARLEVASRSEWRARRSAVRRAARTARAFVPPTKGLERVTPRSVLLAQARKLFAGGIFQGETSEAVVKGWKTGPLSLVIREAPDVQVADLAWGVSAAAIHEALVRGEIEGGSIVTAEAIAHLAAHVRALAERAAERSVAGRGHGGTSTPPPRGPSYRHELRGAPPWRRRSSTAEVCA